MTNAVILQPALPKMVVCLAAYNGMQYLQQQVDSILGQQGVVIRLVVSVDQSTDGTKEWFEALMQSDPRVILLPYGERFGGAAPNFFRLLRDADFSDCVGVALADQDDIWLSDKLQRAAATISGLGMGGYSSDVLAFWESGRTRYIKKSWPQRRWDYLFESSGPGCTFVLSHALALELQSFLIKHQQDMREVYFHDWFIYAYARANDYDWWIDTYAGMRYRQHGENLVGANEGLSAFWKRARRILNGWGLSQAVKVAELSGLGDHPFVKRWSNGSRTGMLWLALQATHCRRSRRDQILFSLSCVGQALVGRSKK